MRGTPTIWYLVDRMLARAGRYRRPVSLAVDGLTVVVAWNATYLFRVGFERWLSIRPDYDLWVMLGVVAAYLFAFAALRMPESEVSGDDESLSQLADLVRDWRRPVDQAAMAPFRLFFRLEEPAPAKDEPPPRRNRRHGRQRAGRDVPRPGQRRWYVRFLLQSAEDPNLLVPTADAWIIRGRKAAALARSGTDVHAALLASMVQAAGVENPYFVINDGVTDDTSIVNGVEVPLQKGMSDRTMARFKTKAMEVQDGRRGQSSSRKRNA